MTRYFLLISILSFSFLSGIAQKPTKPKLIVGIVVEQMRYDYLERYWDKLSNNGFKRLVRAGTQCKNAQYSYAFNHDAVGYATLATGAPPSQHGIIANSWYNRLLKKQEYCVDDEKARTIGSNSQMGNYAPNKLMAGTLGDALKMQSMGKSKVIGIAMKDCGAILSAGRTADGAYWLDSQSGMWISSSFYHSMLPAWVRNFNDRGSADIMLNKRWEPEFNLEYFKESLPDVNEFESGFFGYKKAFPYDFSDLRKRTDDFSLLKSSPFGNTLTRDFAISSIINENLGKDDYTDLLTVGFSATGYLNQYFTPNSVETEDAFLKLDKDLAYLLSFLDQQVGKKNYLLYLTSNTGVIHSQGYLKKMRMANGMFNQHVATSLVRSYLKAIYGSKAEWIKHYEELQLYLDHDAILKSGNKISDVQSHIAEFLVSFEGVATVYTGSTLHTTDFSTGIARKIKNSYNQKRSADLLIVLQPGWVQKDQTTDHNSAYNYDTHVPLFWFGWEIQPKTITTPLSMSDIAVTIATLLNIPKPNAATGKHIWELAD